MGQQNHRRVKQNYYGLVNKNKQKHQRVQQNYYDSYNKTIGESSQQNYYDSYNKTIGESGQQDFYDSVNKTIGESNKTIMTRSTNPSESPTKLLWGSTKLSESQTITVLDFILSELNCLKNMLSL